MNHLAFAGRFLHLQLLGCSLGLLLMLTGTAFSQEPRIGMQQFKSWCFQTFGGSEERAVTALGDQIEAEVARIHQQSPLSDNQKEKLRLAGSGDVQRIMNRVDLAREKFRELEKSDGKGNEFIQQAWQLAAEIQQEFQKGIFGEESLLKKVARTTLTPEQTAAMEFQANEVERQATETAIRVWLAGFSRSIPMDADQRDFLHDWMKEHVKPFTTSSPYRSWVIEHSLSKIPDQELLEHFDEFQLDAIKKRHQRLNLERFVPILKRERLIE